jgi:hypothetical protein
MFYICHVKRSARCQKGLRLKPFRVELSRCRREDQGVPTMSKTYEAIYEDGHLEWLGEQPGQVGIASW